MMLRFVLDKLIFNNLRIGRLFLKMVVILLKFMKPPYIQVESTTRCNLRCEFCERSTRAGKGSDLDLGKFTSFIRGGGFFRPRFTIDLTGVGEPLLNKNLLQMIRCVKETGGWCGFTSNFLLIDEAKAEELIASGLDYIYISLDAASKNLYENMRKGADFGRLMRNISTFITQKRRLQARKPSLSFLSTVTESNGGEILALIKLAADAGVGKVNFQSAGKVHEKPYDPTEIEDFEGLLNDALKLSKERGVTIDTHFLTGKRKWCLPVIPFIAVEGCVLPCCWATQIMPREEYIELSFGNAFEEDFSKIWSSPAYVDFRKKILLGDYPSTCGNCPVVDVQAGE